jgi:DNA-binding PucR family transcriptional regulator
MEKEGDERTKAVAAMLVEKLGLTEEEALKVAGMMTSAGAAGAKEVETKSRWKHVASIIAEKVAQLAANPVLLIAIAIITALAVAIAVLIHNRNKDAEAAKQAAEDQKQATKAYEDAKAAYKELMETISSYKNAEEAISHLTKGT